MIQNATFIFKTVAFDDFYKKRAKHKCLMIVKSRLDLKQYFS